MLLWACITVCGTILTCHLVVLLIDAGDVAQAIPIACGLASFTGTITNDGQ